MAIVSKGFHGKRRGNDGRIPPGQHLTTDFPVLSAGPTPRVSTDRWEFTIVTEMGEKHRWNWQQMRALPNDKPMVDIHCVTTWSKLDTRWRGVSLDTLLDGIDTAATHVMAHGYDGYTTNLPMSEIRGGRAWLAFEFGGKPLGPEHGGPARLLVPHLYFWKSAKWVNKLTLMMRDEPGFWERNGYHDYGDPWQEQRYQGD
ncbi:sulfite oxidase-like oxidoreductase [Rhodococcoides kyotonense]|uniref:DMSO/TMAO reductase YedYZ, molybdopterin-dependent catalytic subunit n=1 Tax=Rhodococcoides kyotonense TaxID=398843 RepID=A0A239EPH7_9NOCA|nr:sulfite oxidase-like oxidoreductase [Rhodococcus kyotonensis]SNS45832.1 DMSO/TMAO reductase YedYZ, molybdopterin-dependent catalytic subunit [Rhodococcus kyotonensis]